MIWLNFWAPDHLQKNLPMKNLWKALAAWMRTRPFQRAWRTGTRKGHRRKRSPQTRRSPSRSEEGCRFSVCCGFSLHSVSRLAFSEEWKHCEVDLNQLPDQLKWWKEECLILSLRSPSLGGRVMVPRPWALGQRLWEWRPVRGTAHLCSARGARWGVSGREDLWTPARRERSVFHFPSPTLHSHFPSEAVKLNWVLIKSIFIWLLLEDWIQITCCRFNGWFSTESCNILKNMNVLCKYSFFTSKIKCEHYFFLLNTEGLLFTPEILLESKTSVWFSSAPTRGWVTSRVVCLGMTNSRYKVCW